MGGGSISDQIRADSKYDLLSLYHDNDSDSEEDDSPFRSGNIKCEYYEPDLYLNKVNHIPSCNSYFHLNCRGITANWGSWVELMCNLNTNTFSFDCIGISELYQCAHDTRVHLPGYHNIITRCRDDGFRGGVGLFVKDKIEYKIRNDLSVFIAHVFESLFIEIDYSPTCKQVIGVIYRPNTAPMADIDIFSSTLFEIMDIVNFENKHCIIMGDMNIDFLKYNSDNKSNEYLDDIIAHGFLPIISIPTRVVKQSATLIDHIYTNRPTNIHKPGVILTDVSDHYGIATLIIDLNKLPSSTLDIFQKLI